MIVQQSEDFLQIDGALNPGDSGGPVLDRAGRVLGVASRGLGEGLHFAVPVARLVYLGVALGGALAVDRVSETRAVLTNDVKAGPTLDIQRDSVLRPIAWPLLSLSAESGSASLAYGVLLDVKDPAASFQRVSLSLVY